MCLYSKKNDGTGITKTVKESYYLTPLVTSPLGNKRQCCWNRSKPSKKGFRKVPDKFCLCGITKAMLAGT